MNLLNEFRKLEGWHRELPGAEELLPDIESNIKSITSCSEHILPEPQLIFNALKHTDFEAVSACVIGQDPYHQRPEINGEIVNQAMGLAFSVPQGVRVPPSLRNIHKELSRSYSDWVAPEHGDLSHWTRDVLLLNTSLTVEFDNPASHSKTGWSKFTDLIVNRLVEREKPIVFLAWGRHAHKVVAAAENTHHLVLKTSHPSPLGARKEGKDFDAFLGSDCFIKANAFLEENGIAPVKW